MNGPPASSPQPRRKARSLRTVGLALLFTLAMLGIGMLAIKYGTPPRRDRPRGLRIQAEPASAVAGQPATLYARVMDSRDQPVAGFVLAFYRQHALLGASPTGENGWAEVTVTFDRPGEFRVDVRPGPTEKRDWRVGDDRVGVPVTVRAPGD